jgi:hypothetical protein
MWLKSKRQKQVKFRMLKLKNGVSPACNRRHACDHSRCRCHRACRHCSTAAAACITLYQYRVRGSNKTAFSIAEAAYHHTVAKLHQVQFEASTTEHAADVLTDSCATQHKNASATATDAAIVMQTDCTEHLIAHSTASRLLTIAVVSTLHNTQRQHDTIHSVSHLWPPSWYMLLWLS